MRCRTEIESRNMGFCRSTFEKLQCHFGFIFGPSKDQGDHLERLCRDQSEKFSFHLEAQQSRSAAFLMDSFDTVIHILLFRCNMALQAPAAILNREPIELVELATEMALCQVLCI